MLENCINLRTEISRIIKELEVLSVQYTIKKNGIGEEHLAKYDISEAWKDYLFVLNGILYRWDNCFNKEDIDGLYWQLNLLRNRFAHSTPGYYSSNTTIAQRYMAISSRIFNVEVKNTQLSLKTTLINLSKNDYFKTVIKEVIIEKKYGKDESKRPIMDLLFSTKPCGKNKNSPNMVL